MIRTGLLAVALVAAAIAFPALARAAPPANDDFANATVIDAASLPFSDSVAIDDATLQSGEPSGCYFAGKSIWYSITPSSRGVLRADIGSSSFFDRVLYVYREDNSGFGGLSTIACASPYYNGQSSATFSVEAGKTYYLQVAGYTFAPEDATRGKVTFQAVATIQGARDAIPADNTFISLPTKVVR